MSEPNPRNLPSFDQIFGNPLPPHCRLHGYTPPYAISICSVLIYRFEDCAFPPIRTEDFASDLGLRRHSDGFSSKAEYVGALLDVLKMRKNLCLSRHFQQLDKESLFDTFRSGRGVHMTSVMRVGEGGIANF